MYIMNNLIALWASSICAINAIAIPGQQQIALQQNDFRLIELSPTEQQWMTEQEIDTLIQNNIGFMDITDNQDLAAVGNLVVHAPITFKAEDSEPTRQFMDQYFNRDINQTRMRSFLEKFSSFHNRYTGGDGVKSAQFLFDYVNEIAAESHLNITVSKFTHKFAQFSIIAKIHGFWESDESVIIGAHQDSINQFNRAGKAPGADDDGSGTTSTLEAFTVLSLNDDFQPLHDVEFHWYAAEELGLLGSQDVAKAYAQEGRKVIAMIQNDMTGYVDPQTRRSGNRHIGVLNDFTNPQLTLKLKDWITKYTDEKPLDTKCGYGCSDHASWTKAGYASAAPFEGLFREINPVIHSPRDTIEKLDFDHMVSFTQLNIAFVVNLAQFV
ncbi:hypothetical protein MIR68_003088 [Amoeboaphelidium protococcarum]|nr:hypothetical protein MIR68_003088 [Amoeboaphelidium protococcarum]